jgi:hypothetical protein
MRADILHCVAVLRTHQRSIILIPHEQLVRIIDCDPLTLLFGPHHSLDNQLLQGCVSSIAALGGYCGSSGRNSAIDGILLTLAYLMVGKKWLDEALCSEPDICGRQTVIGLRRTE